MQDKKSSNQQRKPAQKVEPQAEIVITVDTPAKKADDIVITIEAPAKEEQTVKQTKTEKVQKGEAQQKPANTKKEQKQEKQEPKKEMKEQPKKQEPEKSEKKEENKEVEIKEEPKPQKEKKEKSEKKRTFKPVAREEQIARNNFQILKNDAELARIDAMKFSATINELQLKRSAELQTKRDFFAKNGSQFKKIGEIKAQIEILQTDRKAVLAAADELSAKKLRLQETLGKNPSAERFDAKIAELEDWIEHTRLTKEQEQAKKKEIAQLKRQKEQIDDYKDIYIRTQQKYDEATALKGKIDGLYKEKEELVKKEKIEPFDDSKLEAAEEELKIAQQKRAALQEKAKKLQREVQTAFNAMKEQKAAQPKSTEEKKEKSQKKVEKPKADEVKVE